MGNFCILFLLVDSFFCMLLGCCCMILCVYIIIFFFLLMRGFSDLVCCMNENIKKIYDKILKRIGMWG